MKWRGKEALLLIASVGSEGSEGFCVQKSIYEGAVDANCDGIGSKLSSSWLLAVS